MKVTKAVIPLGGMATRFLPASKSIQKCMFPVVDKPILQYLVEELAESGITDILVLVGRNSDAILNHFDKAPELNDFLVSENKIDLLKKAEKPANMVNITYKRLYEPRGVADALLQAEVFVGSEPFVVVFGDEMFYNKDSSAVKQMLDVYNKTNKNIIGCYEVELKDVHKYGIMKVENLNNILNVTQIVEKPKTEEAPSRLSAVGKYILNSEIFELLKDTSKQFSKEKNFSQALNQLALDNKLVAVDLIGERYDTGSKLGYLLANVAYGLKDQEISNELRKQLIDLLK